MALIGRRQFLCSLPAFAAAPRAMAQGTALRSFRVRALNQIGLTVTDPRRSLAFYQDLWGMPIQARHGSTTVLRIGEGPQLLSITQATAAPPGIHHFGFAVENFDPIRVLQVLGRNGVAAAQSTGDEQILPPLTVRRSIRGSGTSQTVELQLADPDGILVQIQDPSYGGGGGALGNVCAPVEPHRGTCVGRHSGGVTAFPCGRATRGTSSFSPIAKATSGCSCSAPTALSLQSASRRRSLGRRTFRRAGHRRRTTFCTAS